MAAAMVISGWMGSCSKPEPPAGPLREYRMEGEILKVNPAEQTATIKHKDIAGWMHAMTMDYPIRTKEDLAKLHVGDHITAKVYVRDEDYSVGDIKTGQP